MEVRQDLSAVRITRRRLGLQIEGLGGTLGGLGGTPALTRVRSRIAGVPVVDQASPRATKQQPHRKELSSVAPPARSSLGVPILLRRRQMELI